MPLSTVLDRGTRVLWPQDPCREVLGDSTTATAGCAATPEADALLLFTLERVCDSIAEGETEELGLAAGRMTRLLVELVESHLS